MMPRIGLILISALLWSAAFARDRFDTWIAATELTLLIAETGTEVRDRNDHLLRAYTVADGRWRLAVAGDAVDPLFLDMLVAYEDKRFFPPQWGRFSCRRAGLPARRYGIDESSRVAQP